ncbi:PDR/VanB family oxidoreductase [Pseudomonas sp. Irchel s3f7]|uniref:PDR/VanB family oxidoreductase n=1 Tax=Pseudomonas sp. Irchel s3f7 TaxID=2009153 RepID=UPI000BA2F915|nr:PDR/VanB family oxidoreductase [Pseudomonas sp. Irchel s3f7]
MNSASRYPVYVKSVRYEAENIFSFELFPEQGTTLPAFTAGSHIDLFIPGVPTRSYSLLNDQSEANRYEIAVAKDPKSRGGSKLIHELLRAGDRLEVSGPKNLFPLNEASETSVLIAGGIGITPLWSMAQRLESLRAKWRLVYFARNRESAALLDRMNKVFSHGHIELHLAYGVAETIAAIAQVFSQDVAATHYYCCGPSGMLESYKSAAGDVPGDRVHYESFVALHDAATEGGFEVVLAKAGTVVNVQPGQTVLDALAQVGVEVMNSCREGICGACEVVVLEGTPDHRDSILSESEKASNKSMFVCCSGSKSQRLVLDL